MTDEPVSWPRWQLIAVAGLLVIVVLGTTTSTGVWLAERVGWTAWVGWTVGFVAGYPMSRAVTRRAVAPLLA